MYKFSGGPQFFNDEQGDQDIFSVLLRWSDFFTISDTFCMFMWVLVAIASDFQSPEGGTKRRYLPPP